MPTSTFRDPGTGRAFSFKHDKGLTPDQLQALANEKRFDGLKREGNIVTRNLAIGVDTIQQNVFGSALEGIGKSFDLKTLEELGASVIEEQESQMEDRRRFAPRSEGFFPYVTEMAAQSAPISGVGLAGGFAGFKGGAALGTALGGPPGTVIGGAVGGFLGAAGAMLPFFYGGNRERQKEAIERGYRTEVDEGAALLTAIPQSALDGILNAFVVSKVGRAFVPAAIQKGGGIFTRVSKGTAQGVLTETPTELGQQVLERYQAGLPMDTPEAIEEYKAAAAGGAILGGILGGGSGAISRSADVEPDSEEDPEKTKEEKEKEDQERIGKLDEEVGQGEKKIFKVEYTDPDTNEKLVTEVEATSFEEARGLVAEGTGANPNTIALAPEITPEPEPAPEPEPEEDFITVYRGGEVNPDSPLTYTTPNRDQANRYAEGKEESKILTFKVNRGKVAGEEEVRDTLEELGYSQAKEGNPNYVGGMIHEYLDPSFRDEGFYLGDGVDVELTKALEAKGFEAYSAAGTDVSGGTNQSVEEIVLFRKDLNPIPEPTPEPEPEPEEEPEPEPAPEPKPKPKPKPKQFRQQVKDALKLEGARNFLRVDPVNRNPVPLGPLENSIREGVPIGEVATEQEVNERFSDEQLLQALEAANDGGAFRLSSLTGARNIIIPEGVAFDSLSIEERQRIDKEAFKLRKRQKKLQKESFNLQNRLRAKIKEEGYVQTDLDKELEAIAPRGEIIETRDQLKAIVDSFIPIAQKLGFDIDTTYKKSKKGSSARWNPGKNRIQIDVTALFDRVTKGLDERPTGTGANYVRSVMREEIIHGAMDKVLVKKGIMSDQWYIDLGASLTEAQRKALRENYNVEAKSSYGKTGKKSDIDFGYGAEYARAVVQQLLYGNDTQSFTQPGSALEKVKSLIKSTQAYITKALKTLAPKNEDAAAIIAETADLLLKSDPNAKLTNQKTVALSKFLLRQKQANKASGVSTSGVDPAIESAPEQATSSPAPAPKKDYEVESVADEFGDMDYDADEALRKIAKERDLGITSDRDPNTVVRNEDGEVIGGTFVSNDGDNYTFDVVVSEAADGTGVGSKLLDDVIEMPYELRDMNPDATMQVDVVSTKMKEMLERRGFEVKEKIGKGRWLMEPKDYDNIGKSIESAPDLASAAPTPVSAETVAESGKPPSERKGKEEITTVDRYLKTISSLLRSMHPRLALLVDKYYNDIDSKVLGYMTKTKPFFEKINKIKNKKDRKRLTQLIYYSRSLERDPEQGELRIKERDLLLRKYGMYNDFHLRVRVILNKVRTELVNAGYEPGNLDDYFPRKILDLKKVKEYFGDTVKKPFSKFITELNFVTNARQLVVAARKGSGKEPFSAAELAVEVEKKLRAMSLSLEKPEMALDFDTVKKLLPLDQGVILKLGDKKTLEIESMLFDQFMRRGLYTNYSKGLSNLKRRSIDIIPPELMDAYASPGEAFESYVYGATQAIETSRLIGRRFILDGGGDKAERASELARELRELENSGAITPEDTETAYDVFRVILTPQGKESKFFSGLRAASYFTLLVEFTSTLSQVFDLPFIMARAGVDNTFKALISQKLGVDLLGIDSKRVSEEFRDPLFMDKAVRLGLKVTGFTRMDQFMKETNITANFMRFRKIAKAAANTPNGRRFRAEMEFMGFNDAEIIKLKAALQKGDSNNALVRLALFSRLSETQPTSKARMPLKQAENPDTRLLYTMKSFLVNQLNLTNDLYIQQMKNGTRQQKAEAFLNLSKLIVFMAMVGMPVDMLKDLIAGRLGYLPDYAVNNSLRIFGISKYSAYKIKRDGVGAFALNYFQPVALQQFVDITKSVQQLAEGTPIERTKLMTLAPMSDVLNRIFGFTKQKEQREFKRRLKEGERPFFTPPGAL